jgi:hypothetical protein
MLKPLYKKLHSLWESPEQPARMPFATTQTLPMRYIDIDVLQDQLNQILGEDGWDSQGVCINIFKAHPMLEY